MEGVVWLEVYNYLYNIEIPLYSRLYIPYSILKQLTKVFVNNGEPLNLTHRYHNHKNKRKQALPNDEYLQFS